MTVGPSPSSTACGSGTRSTAAGAYRKKGAARERAGTPRPGKLRPEHRGLRAVLWAALAGFSSPLPRGRAAGRPGLHRLGLVMRSRGHRAPPGTLIDAPRLWGAA